MNARLIALIKLDLTQRVRSVAWYVLLGVFAALMLGVTALSFVSFSYVDESAGSGPYSVVVFFTLLLVLLVSPTLSGNSINGDRDAATLAPVQVTLATPAQILWAKFFAAWVTGLAFVGVAVPFLVVAALTGTVHPATALISVLVLTAEIGIVAAIGVALSALLSRPLFSVATTYLVVAALTVGTLIVFVLVGSSVSTEVTNRGEVPLLDDQGSPVCIEGVATCWDEPENQVCDPNGSSEWTMRVGRFDTVWWVLASNPFVVLADATPTQFGDYGYPSDMFGFLKVGVRTAQIPPALEPTVDGCGTAWVEPPSPEEVVNSTVPSWFVGLGVQLALAGVLMWRAIARLRTPARRLPMGTRIA